MKKIIIIGAVAAGTSCAAKARRNDESASIKIYEKDNFISYSGCGMPYYLGNEVESIDTLTPRNPSFFKKKYNIDIHIGHEVLSIDSKNKKITVKDLATSNIFEDDYDTLVLATGAIVNRPNIVGIDNQKVFFLRNIKDAINIKNYIENYKPKNAIIAGTGFIGFELLESLTSLDINVSVVEANNQITPNLDYDMSLYLESLLAKKDIKIIKNTTIKEITNDKVILSNDTDIDNDLVILATGVKPNTVLAKSIGLELGLYDSIKVNTSMQTSEKDIYACGDCIETYSSITGLPNYRPLGSTANKTGRICGDSITKGNLKYQGNLGTGIFKLFNLSVASTGLSEKEALELGYSIEICHNIKPNKPDYLGGKEMLIKAIADKETSRILGIQIIGEEGVDKRIDVFATLITYKAKVDELFHLDLAYAPPFSTTKDPIHYTGMILDNAINTDRKLITTSDLELLNEKVQIIDARSEADYLKKGHLTNAINIPQAKLRDELTLDKDVTTITYCNKGVTGNAAQNILINKGFKKVYNLSGGQRLNKILKEGRNK